MINVMYVGLLLNLIYHSGHNVYTKSVNEASCMAQTLTIGCGGLWVREAMRSWANTYAQDCTS